MSDMVFFNLKHDKWVDPVTHQLVDEPVAISLNAFIATRNARALIAKLYNHDGSRQRDILHLTIADDLTHWLDRISNAKTKLFLSENPHLVHRYDDSYKVVLERMAHSHKNYGYAICAKALDEDHRAEVRSISHQRHPGFENPASNAATKVRPYYMFPDIISVGLKLSGIPVINIREELEAGFLADPDPEAR
jgi:hypothetical protein